MATASSTPGGEELHPFRFLLPTEVHYGNGTAHKIPELVRRYGKHPFIVCGKSSARASGLLDRVLQALPGAVVFDQVEPDPTVKTCDRATAVCRAERCDVILAIGGGSPIDAAKAVAVAVANAGSVSDYINVLGPEVHSLPLITVPTTAGAGSETTPYAVLVDETERTKRSIAGPALFPRASVVDPELTLSMPHSITIASGLDALSQGMEGYVSRQATPISDALAPEVVRIARQWLPVVAAEPANLEARGWMHYAAMLSGCVIAQTGTTVVHGMGYHYTVHCGVTHGLANALLLPPVFRYSARYLPEKAAVLAEALGETVPPVPRDDPEAVGASVAQGIYRLLEQLDVSPAARDHDVDESLLPVFAVAIDEKRLRNQVGSLATQDIERLYHESWAGELEGAASA